MSGIGKFILISIIVALPIPPAVAAILAVIVAQLLRDLIVFLKCPEKNNHIRC